MTDSDEPELIAKTSLFQWNVNISRFEDKAVGGFLISPMFSSYNNSGIKSSWQLVLYPKGYTETEKGYMSLYLERITGKNEVCVKFYFLLLNQKNEKVNLKLHEARYNKGEISCWGSLKFLEESFVNDSQNKLIKDNKLRFVCKIVMEKVCTKNQAEPQNDKNVRLKELDKFEKLLTDNEFSDVIIIAQEKHFYLHKCILSTSSDVFKAMFTTDMKEKNQSTVKIEDITCDVLEELFRFIYTGKINNIKKIVDKLLIAAEKYCMDGLKELCEDTMCYELKQCNALEYLNLAIMNNAEKLRREAINLISLYLDVLIDKKELVDLDKQHPGVLHEITKKYINNQI